MRALTCLRTSCRLLLTTKEGHLATIYDSGACLGSDPGFWDTSTRDGKTSRIGTVVISGVKMPRMKAIYIAKSICGSCEVRVPCLEAGREEAEGTWGGLLPDER